MSIEDLQIVDFIGTDSDDVVVLTISDHLEWDNEHLLKLQEKVNTYLSFIESGEVYEAYPLSKGKSLKINLMCKFEPNSDSVSFLLQCGEIISQAGFDFDYQVGI